MVNDHWSSGSSWSLVSSLPEPHQYWSSVGILTHKSWLPTSLSLSVTHWPTLLLDCLVTLNTLHRFLIILNIFLSFNVSLNFFLRVVRLNLSLGLEFSRERISQQFHRFLLILNSSVNFIIYCLVNTQNLLSSTHYKLNLQSMTDETYVNGTYHMKAIFRMKGIMHCYCYFVSSPLLIWCYLPNRWDPNSRSNWRKPCIFLAPSKTHSGTFLHSWKRKILVYIFDAKFKIWLTQEATNISQRRSP